MRGSRDRVKKGSRGGDYEDREELAVPSPFDFVSNYDATVRFIRTIPALTLNKERSVLLDFHEIQQVSVSALLVLAAEIQRCRKYGATDRLDGTYPKDDRIERMLESTGFFRLLGVRHRTRRAPRRYPVDYIPFISEQKAEGKDFVRLQRKLFGSTIKINPLASAKLYRGVTEAMANVVEHAYPSDAEIGDIPRLDRQWWLAGHIHRPRRQLLISIFDQGVGIPKTLPKKLAIEHWRSFLEDVFKVQFSDGEMIRAAMTIGRTQTKEPYRGKGLIQMREIVTECKDASLHILSLGGDYLFKSDGSEEVRKRDFTLGGTLIEWRVPLDSIVVDAKYLEEVT